MAGTRRAFSSGMTPLISGHPEHHLTRLPRVVRSVLLLLCLAILPGVVRPTVLQAQVRSGIASVALSAYAAPGVRWPGAGPRSAVVAGEPATALAGMTVNTEYRVERRVSAESSVVLWSHGVPGVVPWDRIRAALDGSTTEPVVIDVVVTPAL